MKNFSIAPENQSVLFHTARASIEHFLLTGKLPAFASTDNQLKESAAVFVTLTKNGDLRGCIGTTEPEAPLQTAVSRMAVAAAVEDYRFPPVTAAELKEIRIEISVLSPMKRIFNPAEILQNTHGVAVRKGMHSGLFLPQVWEKFPDKEAFMTALCRHKAGLAADAWRKPGTKLQAFTARCFQ